MTEAKEPVLPFGSFLFPRVFEAFRMSIQPTKLILAFLALATVCLTGRLMDLHETVIVAPHGITELDVYIAQGNLDAYVEQFAESEDRSGVFATLWNYCAERFHDGLRALAQGNALGITQNIAACFVALIWAFQYHTLYSILFFAVMLAVMSLAGGSICRIAALQFAQGEKPGVNESVRFGLRKFASLLTAPITMIAIMAVIGAFIILLGLVGNIPWIGQLSVGLFLPLALMAAALVAIIGIGILGGFNLMFPAIAYEDSDCFDAISRSFSYVYAKPWRMGFYTVTAAVYGAICYAFVRFFTYLLLQITYFFLQVGFLQDNEKLTAIWPQPNFTDFLGSTAAAPGNWTASVGAFLVYVSVLCVVGLMVSFVISFYFTANTIIYALMRNRVDRTALDEIYTGSDEISAESLATVGSPAPPAAAATENETDEPDENAPASE